MTDAEQASLKAEPGSDLTFGDLCREFGDRWGIAPITGGYRAIPSDTSGGTPIPRYGRTPAELAESIRLAEGSL